MSRLSRELEYRIRYDVEHNLFHVKNVFNEEYIPPTFIEYVQKLEAQIEKMKRYLDCECCEHYTQPCGCKNCNEEVKSDWKLKEIKENE